MIRTKTEKGEKSDAIIIKKPELDEIRSRFVIKTK